MASVRSEQCVFCAIVAGDTEASLVYEDEVAVVSPCGEVGVRTNPASGRCACCMSAATGSCLHKLACL